MFGGFIHRHEVVKFEPPSPTEKPEPVMLDKEQMMKRLGFDSLAEFDAADKAYALPRRRVCRNLFGLTPFMTDEEWRLDDVIEWERSIIDAANKPLIKKHIAAQVKQYKADALRRP